MSAPTIAVATNNGDMGGGEVMLLNIATALRELGIDVLVLGPTRPGDVLIEAEARGFRTEPLEASTRLGYMDALLRWRLRHRRIPLWCNGLVPTVATTAIGPRIAHLHMVPTGLNALAAKIGRIGARRVIVPSTYMASHVPSATVLENWTQDISLRPRSFPSTGPLRVGFLGRLTRDKGVDVLARAMQQVIEESRRGVRLVIAGENRFGDAEDDCLIQAALEPIEAHVDRLGWVDKERFFEQIDIAVFPSVVPESFGLVAVEAMAGGVPFIVSDAGALPEVVGTSYPWVARRGDESSLGRTILRMLDTLDSGDARTAETARSRWEEEFSPPAGTRRVAALVGGLPRVSRTWGREGMRDVR